MSLHSSQIFLRKTLYHGPVQLLRIMLSKCYVLFPSFHGKAGSKLVVLDYH